MLELLKEIIVDFQELPSLNTGVPRQVSSVVIPGKASIYIGVRRSGKSTYLFQLIQGLLDQGVSRENILYLNFFDDRLHSFQQEFHSSQKDPQQAELGTILEAYFALYPEKKNSETIHCFFDEIQVVPRWESFIDRIMRAENCEVTITGSSARMLSKEIATQMRGRALSWEMFPFSLAEYLDFRKLNYASPISTKKRLIIQKAFDDYWQTGGFPEVVGLEPYLRTKIHQEYFNSVLFRDLIERHDISHPKAIIDLAHWLVDNNASLYSINKLTGYLKSLGHKVPKASVADYLTWFEDAYFLFTVRIFDSSLARSNANPKKNYCIDHALVTSVSSGILINSGHLLENLVFISLRRKTADIFYYKTKKGHEVDFIAGNFLSSEKQTQKNNPSHFLVQVCETMLSPKTRQREVTALSEAMVELKFTTAFIVTRSEGELITLDFGQIKIVPIWRFLLMVL